jgi:hypothetical protein
MGNGVNRWTVGYRTSVQTAEEDTFNRARFDITQFYLADPITKTFTRDKAGAYFFKTYQDARAYPKRAQLRAEPVKVWLWNSRNQ